MRSSVGLANQKQRVGQCGEFSRALSVRVRLALREHARSTVIRRSRRLSNCEMLRKSQLYTKCLLAHLKTPHYIHIFVKSGCIVVDNKAPQA